MTKNKTIKTRIIATVILFGTITFSACASVPSNSNTTSINVNKESNKPVPEKSRIVEANNGKVPAAVIDAGEFSENIYDYAKVKNWAKAEAKLNSLEKSVAELKTANLATPKIIEIANSIGKAVKAKNQIDAMRESNQSTFLIADLSAQFNPKVPVEVTKLDYYGREIEIWVINKDEAKLKQTVAAIRQTWNAVKPKMEAKGASKEEAKFESLVVQAEKAVTIAEYSKVAMPILDEVDNLEKVFEK